MTPRVVSALLCAAIVLAGSVTLASAQGVWNANSPRSRQILSANPTERVFTSPGTQSPSPAPYQAPWRELNGQVGKPAWGTAGGSSWNSYGANGWSPNAPK